jgi:hypothetical protein
MASKIANTKSNTKKIHAREYNGGIQKENRKIRAIAKIAVKNLG